MKYAISLDVGTTKSAFLVGAYIDYTNTFEIIDKGIVDNEELIDIVRMNCKNGCDLVYEEFASYGMPIGETTMRSILWNGRFIQVATECGAEIYPIKRMQVKMNLCHTSKAKDTNIRQALIDRFGVVGVMKNKGFFYGVSKDIWSAIAIFVTHMDFESKR